MKTVFGTNPNFTKAKTIKFCHLLYVRNNFKNPDGLGEGGCSTRCVSTLQRTCVNRQDRTAFEGHVQHSFLLSEPTLVNIEPSSLIQVLC